MHEFKPFLNRIVTIFEIVLSKAVDMGSRPPKLNKNGDEGVLQRWREVETSWKTAHRQHLWEIVALCEVVGAVALDAEQVLEEEEEDSEADQS